MAARARIGTVLCPVDASRPDDAAIDTAREVFGARFVLHRNVTAPSLGMARQWQWGATHESHAAMQPDVRLLGPIVNRIGREIRTEGVVTIGPPRAFIELARTLPADLIVLGTPGRPSRRLCRRAPSGVRRRRDACARPARSWSSNTTRAIVDGAPCPVWRGPIAGRSVEQAHDRAARVVPIHPTRRIRRATKPARAGSSNQ